MTTAKPNPAPDLANPSLAPPYSYTAALLSYLVPGLGQISQGRIGKGVLFMVCLYGLFFTGMAMGGWRNVYIAQSAQNGAADQPWANNAMHLPRPLANLYNRLHYVGQFWIGAAAWPAIWQYNHLWVPSEESSPFLHNFERAPTEQEEIEENQDHGKLPDVAWVYTVIAGVLNILVIYDAFAGPAFIAGAVSSDPTKKEAPRPASPAPNNVPVRPEQEATVA